MRSRSNVPIRLRDAVGDTILKQHRWGNTVGNNTRNFEMKQAIIIRGIPKNMEHISLIIFVLIVINCTAIFSQNNSFAIPEENLEAAKKYLQPKQLSPDAALLILDATAGVTEQDRILGQKIADDGRACVIVCNKWDAVVDKDSSTYEKSIKYMRSELPQMRWAPILFVSAVSGQRVSKIYGTIDDAVQAHRKRISTAVLNEVLRDAILWQPPPALRRNGSQAKIYYCNQVSVRPPTIVVFVNDPKLVNDNYKRYLDRKFRESLNGFEATPIRWIFRGRRQRDVMRSGNGGTMNGAPGDGGAGVSFPFPHAD